ncbi:cyclophilin-like fold protein [Streptosporangium canum]
MTRALRITATMNGSPAAREFLQTLPLELTMRDLPGREKYAALPPAA